jgi:hypothetical protein
MPHRHASFRQPACQGISSVAGITPRKRSLTELSAFAPISLFFLVSGSDYPFLLLMHVGIFAVCGAGGLVTIFRDFSQVRAPMYETEQRSISSLLLYAWMLLYIFVGTQMAFNLAPFVNRPGDEVTLFNQMPGNFYSYLWDVYAEWMQR